MDFAEYDRGLLGPYRDYLLHLQDIAAKGGKALSPAEFYGPDRKFDSKELSYLLGLKKMHEGVDYRYGEPIPGSDGKTSSDPESAYTQMMETSLSGGDRPSDRIPEFLAGLLQAQKFREYGW